MNGNYKKSQETLKEIENLRKVLYSTSKKPKPIGRKPQTKRINELKSRLAWLLLDAGEFQESLALYNTLPWTTYGEEKYLGISRAYIELAEYPEAESCLQKGLARYPESGPLYVSRGMLKRRLGDSYGASEDFQHALDLMPDNRHALYDHALTLNELGYNKDASDILRRLVRNYPDDPEYTLELGYTLLELGHPKDAVDLYRKTREMGFESPSVYGGLCCAYIDLGMKSDALEVASEGLRKFPDEHPGLYENLGEVYKDMGWKDEARDILSRGLKKFPDDDNLKRLLQEVDDDDHPAGDKNRPLTGLIYFLLTLKKLREKLFRK